MVNLDHQDHQDHLELEEFKEKKVIQSSVGDDLIASLVAQSQNKAETSDETPVTAPVVKSKPKKSSGKKAAKKPKKPKLTDEEKAAKKAAAAEKRKAAAKAKKAAKAQAKKAAELEAMKAKMLAMQKEMEEAAAKLTAKPETSAEKVDSPVENDGELELEVIQAPSPVVETAKPETSVEKQVEANQAKIEALEKEHSELKAETSAEKVKTPSPLLEICVDAKVSANSETSDTFNAETDGEGSDGEDSDDEDEVKVVKFVHDGTTYLRASDNMLYDPATSECVGCWNPATEQIEEVEEFGSDEESDDEE